MTKIKGSTDSHQAFWCETYKLKTGTQIAPSTQTVSKIEKVIRGKHKGINNNEKERQYSLSGTRMPIANRAHLVPGMTES